MSTSPIALTSVQSTTAAPSFSWSRYSVRALATIGVATLANAGFYYLASAVIAYDPEFLPLANVSGAVIFTMAPAIVAPLLSAGLLRFTRHPAVIFTACAAVVFVVTLIPDF